MSTSIEMPKYKCHTDFFALQISEATPCDGGELLGFLDKRYAPIKVTKEWWDYHKPRHGSYLVFSDDGHMSCIPRKAFESGYSSADESKNWRTDLTKFESDVLEALDLGNYTPDDWKSVALTCLGNAVRRSACLSRIENYMVETVQDDEDEDPTEESLLRWGQEPDEYIETFKVALPEFVQQQSPICITGKELEPHEIKDLVEALPDTVFINRPDAVLVPDPSKNEHGVKALVIPEGWALVPSRFEVSGDVMSEICQMVASGGHSIERFDKATFCVKSIQDGETGEMVYGLHLFNSECPEEGGSTVFEFEPLAVEPETAKLGAAFRLAAQIAGIKDEVADFMAGLDGALLAGKSIEALHDEIMERIALYDTPEAVDLFMNLVKTREAGLPDGLTPEAIELLKGLPFPHRRIAMVFDAPNLGDGYMMPEVVQAFNESHRRSDWGKYPFTASNDITINVINLSAGGSPGEISVEPPLQHVNKTNQQGQIELLTAALDAARHELDGKYISATATVIDAYQLPPSGEKVPDSFVEWCDKVGFTEYTSERDEGLDVHTLEGPMRAEPGDWIVKVNGEFFPHDPELFAARYTSAAELLG